MFGMSKDEMREEYSRQRGLSDDRLRQASDMKIIFLVLARLLDNVSADQVLVDECLYRGGKR